jgi:glycosyltransferase involved in cell wall biosynthesis
MAEAQACGTPVIAFDRGAAAEIVQDGVTGFLVNSVEEMVAAVGRLKEIDLRACRRHVETHFDTDVMASGYLRVYQSILEHGADALAGVALDRNTPQQAVRPSGDARPTLVA